MQLVALAYAAVHLLPHHTSEMFRHIFLDSCRSSFIYHPKGRSSTCNSSSMMDATLAIKHSGLEHRFWLRRCGSRLNSLDTLYELCNCLIWLTILPMLEGPDRAFGKASLVLAVVQLLAIQLTPRLWVKTRSLLLSSALLLRCALLLLQARPAPDISTVPAAPAMFTAGQHMQQQAASAQDTNIFASMTVAAGVWGNLLFVLFHQQPVRIQLPLLAASSLLQALSCSHTGFALSSSVISPPGALYAAANSSNSALYGTGASISAGSSSSSGGAGSNFSWLPALQPHPQGSGTELVGFSETLKWGFGLLAAGGINPGSTLWQVAGPQQEASLLAAKLFVHGFGGFLLPVFVAYVIEWRYKVMFLLTACNLPQQQQLQVLTPAAAIVRASLLLALLLYVGWLLLLATSTWLLCCGVASVLLA